MAVTNKIGGFYLKSDYFSSISILLTVEPNKNTLRVIKFQSMNALFKKSGSLAHHLRSVQAIKNNRNLLVEDEHQHVTKVFEMVKDFGCHQVTRKDIEHYRNRVTSGHEWKIEGLVESYIAYCDFVISLTETGFKLVVYEFPGLMDSTFSRGDLDEFIAEIKYSYSAIHATVYN